MAGGKRLHESTSPNKNPTKKSRISSNVSSPIRTRAKTLDKSSKSPPNSTVSAPQLQSPVDITFNPPLLNNLSFNSGSTSKINKTPKLLIPTFQDKGFEASVNSLNINNSATPSKSPNSKPMPMEISPQILVTPLIEGASSEKTKSQNIHSNDTTVNIEETLKEIIEKSRKTRAIAKKAKTTAVESSIPPSISFTSDDVDYTPESTEDRDDSESYSNTVSIKATVHSTAKSQRMTINSEFSHSEYEVKRQHPHVFYDVSDDVWASLINIVVLKEKYISRHHLESFNLVGFLKDRNLLHAITKCSKPFLPIAIVEFYASISENFKDPFHAAYRKVMIRKKFYDFSVEKINESLGFKESDGDEENMCDMDEVVSYISGGKVTEWHTNLFASILTSKFFLLYRIAVQNWIPSKNGSKLTKIQAELLFKIGRNLKFNLGSIIMANFDYICVKDKGKITKLPYPSLIYDILVKQKFTKIRGEYITLKAEELPISKKNILDGSRICDLPIPKEDDSINDDDELFDVLTNVPKGASANKQLIKTFDSEIGKLVLQANKMKKQAESLETKIGHLQVLRQKLIDTFNAPNEGESSRANEESSG